MKKNLFTAFILIALIATACKKSGDYHFATITGRWYYTSSTTDTLFAGQWKPPHTAYDSVFASTLADSLQFTATDTVYYTYMGVTTWSNYLIGGNHLQLVGSGASNMFTIQTLSNTVLQIGTQDPGASYWATFTRY